MKRVLLDENLDWRLKIHFSDNFEVVSVPDLGWQSKKNGELLSAMESEGFEILLTADRNLRFQQNLENFSVLVVVVVTFDVRLTALVPHIGRIEKAILESDGTDRIVEVDLQPRSTFR